MVQAGHSVSLIMDGWQWSHLVVGSTSRLPFPASILGLWFPKLGVAIAVTLNAIVKESLIFPVGRFDLEFPALFCIFLYQTLGHINSYGMVRVRVPYISPRGESPTRRLFQALQPYLTPKRLAPWLDFTMNPTWWVCRQGNLAWSGVWPYTHYWVANLWGYCTLLS